jgi:integrase
MPKLVKELSDVQVRRLSHGKILGDPKVSDDTRKRKIGEPCVAYHPVGGVAGLLLKVTPSGARSWILRAKVGDLRRDIGLGGYPSVTLSGAREAARKARELIREGTDPVEEKRRQKASLKRQQAVRITFRDAWQEFWRDKAVKFSDKTQAHWVNSVEKYALPLIGSAVVSEIETLQIEKVLRPIWEEKTMLAKKLRGRLESILSWATVKGYRTGDNPARWKDNLKEILPSPSEVHKVTHHRAMDMDEVPGFIAQLRTREGNAARALEFLIMTACRSGEVRGARWDEIKNGTWTIPSERMKMDRDHSIPLSEAALSLLDEMPKDNELIFPAPRGGQLSDMSMLAVLKRMGAIEKTTVHGFRSIFKGWADENDIQDFVSELALAHSVGSDVMKAYRRSDLTSKRLSMARQWAAFLGYENQVSKVVSIGGDRP